MGHAACNAGELAGSARTLCFGGFAGGWAAERGVLGAVGNQPTEIMSDLKPDEQDTIEKLKTAYMEDEGMPEYMADARAKAVVNRLAGRSDDVFDARSGVGDHQYRPDVGSGEEGRNLSPSKTATEQ